ncbi:unnamed protein product [Parascedosporium putredinis]|uniref:PAS-like domain-containing protein n=1 Tax=Parascedosporium putredinis TaxID=1442378 RepID=A0A9P1GY55_9PEZI|nr:unnamed protein product [Parascedosporium putredinis]CAI7989803.1 unnamed protein product [Parascedosporium putredinis]
MDEDVPAELRELEADRLNSLAEFSSLSIVEVLDQDSRPTFVIDLDPDEGITVGSRRIQPVFCNAALRLHEKLFDTVTGKAPDDALHDADKPSYEDFSSWATGVTRFDSSRDVFPQSFIFRDMLWTGSTVRQRWRLVSGSLLAAFAPQREKSSAAAAAATTRSQATQSQPPVAHDLAHSASATDASDSTARNTIFSSNTQGQSSQSSRHPSNPNPNTSSSGSTGGSSQSARITLATPERPTVNWANTPLGPMEKWSPEFRQMANLVMGNPTPPPCFGAAT